MLVAKNEQNQLVNLLEVENPNKGNYRCPACDGAVRLKRGKIVRPHFSHVSLKDCQYHWENESIQHLQLKAHLYRWLQKEEPVELEKPLPQIGQVADLLVGGRLALEVQCSPLSIDRLRERSVSYRQAGFQVLWLLGKNLWLKDRLTKLQKQFLSFSLNRGFHLWELDLDRRELRLHYLIHEDWKGQVHHLTQSFPFAQQSLLSILRLPFVKQKPQSFRGDMDKDLLNYVAQQLYYRAPKWMKWQAALYQEGENLLTRSLEDFYPQLFLPTSPIGFSQIDRDLTAFYQAFHHYYQMQADKSYQILYPPVFYQKMQLAETSGKTIHLTEEKFNRRSW